MSLRVHPLKSALHNKECSCEDPRPRLSCRAQPGMWDRSLTRSVERSSIAFKGDRQGSGEGVEREIQSRK